MQSQVRKRRCQWVPVVAMIITLTALYLHSTYGEKLEAATAPITASSAVAAK